MKKLLIFSLVSLVLITAGMDSYGQQRDIKAILKRDIVKTENGMYSIQEYGTASSLDKEFQVSINAQAPVSLLSKDNFTRFYGALSTSIFTTYFSQEGLKATDDFHILLKDKPGEPVNLKVEIVMSESGIDYTLSFQGGKSQMHLNWLTQLYQEVEK